MCAMPTELLTHQITVLDVHIIQTGPNSFVCTAHAGTRTLALTQYSNGIKPSLEDALTGLARQLGEHP